MTAKERVEQAFAAVEPELREISHWMYEHPETAFEEFESSAGWLAFLGEHGLRGGVPGLRPRHRLCRPGRARPGPR